MVYDFNILCVKPGTYNNLESLINAAKSGQTIFSAGGTGPAGGPDSICTLKLNQAANIKISYLPQKGGGDVVASLLGGHITMGWFNPSEIIPQIEAGKAVPLAITSEKRLAVLPNVPTFKELGYNIVYVQQRGLAMKKGVPADIVQYWIEVLDKVRNTKEWQDGYLKKNSLEDGWLPGQEFKKWMEYELVDFKKSLKALKGMGG
jgi:putative tricarboxylic transport membrane protein